MFKNYTLIVCRRQQKNDENGKIEAQILLGMKKRGFGIGKYNGFGGKLEQGETMRMSAIRELEEESGLIAKALILRGTLLFYMKQSKMIMNIHVYECEDFIGEAVETDEMIPRWFPEDQIPFEQMWPDDLFWLPTLLRRRNFTARFDYDTDDVIIRYTIEETKAKL